MEVKIYCTEIATQGAKSYILMQMKGDCEHEWTAEVDSELYKKDWFKCIQPLCISQMRQEVSVPPLVPIPPEQQKTYESVLSMKGE